MRQVKVCVVVVLLSAVAWSTGIATARATAEPRYDRFFSRRSGNVVRIPTRCWAEDSLAHLYMWDFDGAKLTLHCKHRGY